MISYIYVSYLQSLFMKDFMQHYTQENFLSQFLIGSGFVTGRVSKVKGPFTFSLFSDKKVQVGQGLPVITLSKKYSSKEVIRITQNTNWRKRFLEVLILKVCESFPFRETEKVIVYFGLYGSSLHFCEREDQLNVIFEK